MSREILAFGILAMAAGIAALTGVDFANMAASGVTAIQSSLGPLAFTVDQYTHLGAVAVTSAAKIVDDAGAIEAMTTGELAGMPIYPAGASAGAGLCARRAPSMRMAVADRNLRTRSNVVGLRMMSICANDGQSCAACATSPHTPQPTQSLLTWAMGSGRSGSSLALMVSEGQPDSRMQE